MRFDPVALVEAAYTQDGDDAAWLRRVVDAAAPLAQDRGIVATDPSYRGCIISSMSNTPIALPPRLRRTLRMVAAHLAAGSRMRPFFTASRGAPVEAVLDSSARMQHADGDAKHGAARTVLVDAVKRIERARGRLRRTDPDAALSLWHALVGGRWSLVDRIDSDGRRFVLARRNEPGIRDPRALAERERQVVAHALLGQSNKLIAYQLGIRESTVSSHLVRACKKLGVRSRTELLRVFASPSESSAR